MLDFFFFLLFFSSDFCEFSSEFQLEFIVIYRINYLNLGQPDTNEDFYGVPLFRTRLLVHALNKGDGNSNNNLCVCVRMC